MAVPVGRPRGRGGLWQAAAIAAACTPLVVFARWGPDWPAQQFRAATAAGSGVLAWTQQWYGGQALPGYSVLYPYVSAVLGASGTAVLGAAVLGWAGIRLIPTRPPPAFRITVAALLLTIACCVVLGQVPFLLGAGLGTVALTAVVERRGWPAAGAAIACALASPLAGALLLVAGAGLSARVGWRRVLFLAPGLCGALVSFVIGGAGGRFPFAWTALVGVVLGAVLVFFLTEPGDAVLRRGAWVYALVSLVLFAIPTPIGGNIDRLGKLLLLPVTCFLLARGWDRRRAVAALILAATLCWPALPVASAVSRGAADPSREQSFYTPLLSYLRSRPDHGRLEIPFTREHWEAAFVAPSVPLARGWERQTDLQYNDVLYAPLTASTYRRWLDDNAVSWVALPDVPIDYGGQAEAALLQHPPSYLRPVWHNAHWRVWQVLEPRPMITGPAALAFDGPAGIRLTFQQAGTVSIRVRYSALWVVTAGRGCVGRDGEWLSVASPAPSEVVLAAKVGTHLLTGVGGCAVPP